jgi:hypothetical protein
MVIPIVCFDIGNDIADTVTRMNPVPVKLKFEKVGEVHVELGPFIKSNSIL